MFDQTLEYFSGYPMILAPNGPERLRRAKLDGRPLDLYLDRRGNRVQVRHLTRDFHLYILVSRTSAVFDGRAVWDPVTRTVQTQIKFETRPECTVVPALLVLDGSSPYDLPHGLDVANLVNVLPAASAAGGDLTGLRFIHGDGSEVGLRLSPDLFHFIKFRASDANLTDFKVEYIGIACGPNGDVSVFDRARAHERVNEIQGDLQQHYRNRDLFILAYDPGYVLRGLTTMSSSAVVESIVKGGIVSAYEAMEASLISYFQPTYNIEFKNFPKSRPGWLQGDLYSLNGVSLRVSRIAATLVSDSSFNIPGARWTFGRLWSEAKAAQAVHFVDLPNLMSTEGNWL